MRYLTIPLLALVLLGGCERLGYAPAIVHEGDRTTVERLPSEKPGTVHVRAHITHGKRIIFVRPPKEK